jgi:hypothetical protein
MVAMVVHELPVITETKAHTTQVQNKNNEG